MNAIGIDMAKDTFQAAFNDTVVRQFENTEVGIEKFISFLSRYDSAHVTVGVEATGVYHLLLCARLSLSGWRIVVINPLLMPKLSSNTFAMGARQLVVQEALEIMLCFLGSYLSSLTPSTIVISWPLAGAEITTFFAHGE